CERPQRFGWRGIVGLAGVARDDYCVAAQAVEELGRLADRGGAPEGRDVEVRQLDDGALLDERPELVRPESRHRKRGMLDEEASYPGAAGGAEDGCKCRS